MKSSIQRARRFFLSRLFPGYSKATLREIEDNKKTAEDLAEEVNLLGADLAKRAAELRDALARLELANAKTQMAQESARSWEQTAQEAIRRLNEQAALNADLLQQRFEITVDMARHSGAVDAMKFQVLTQFTARVLILKPNLLSALHDAFSLNVARHIIKKLAAGDYMRADQPMSEQDYTALCQGTHGAVTKKPTQIENRLR